VTGRDDGAAAVMALRTVQIEGGAGLVDRALERFEALAPCARSSALVGRGLRRRVFGNGSTTLGIAPLMSSHPRAAMRWRDRFRSQFMRAMHPSAGRPIFFARADFRK
jgi:hypothetical protein